MQSSADEISLVYIENKKSPEGNRSSFCFYGNLQLPVYPK